MEKQVEYAIEFDNYGHPRKTGRIEIRELENEDDMGERLVLVLNDEETTLLTSDRDQWGTWYSIQDRTIAQEDGTKSFLDALIHALEIFKHRNEPANPDANVLPIEPKTEI
jgi:hypothetical protein